LRSSKLRESAHSGLEQLAEKTGETATLEVLSDGKMLILDEVLGDRLVGAAPSLGTAWALHATSTGKAILAALPQSRVGELLPRTLARFTPKTITARARLDEALEQVRGRGYATALEELEEGYSAAGAVIRTPMLEPYAALSLGGPSARLSQGVVEELGGLVKSCADRISAELGFEN
jgi:IclR family acetate operon transcriptional repressor